MQIVKSLSHIKTHRGIRNDTFYQGHRILICKDLSMWFQIKGNKYLKLDATATDFAIAKMDEDNV